MLSGQISRSIVASGSRVASRGVVARTGGVVAAGRTRLYSSTMHENDPEVLQREKDKSLSKTRKQSSPHTDAPGWNEVLASASEAAVKADRHAAKPSDMIKTTVELHSAERDASEGDGTQSTTAFYNVDEVTGPLKGMGKELKDKDIGEIGEKVSEKVGEVVREVEKKLTK